MYWCSDQFSNFFSRKVNKYEVLLSLKDHICTEAVVVILLLLDSALGVSGGREAVIMAA